MDALPAMDLSVIKLSEIDRNLVTQTALIASKPQSLKTSYSQRGLETSIRVQDIEPVTLHRSERHPEFRYLHDGDHVYLDYTGAGLAGYSQYKKQTERLLSTVHGNPHSPSPTSLESTRQIEKTRMRVLNFLNASQEEYMVVFTPNATGASRLVGESYPFTRFNRFVLLNDNHNSVNGIREFARRRGARTTYISCESSDLRVSERRLRKALRSQVPSLGKNSLFAMPAQSNFSGVKHPLEWVETAQSMGYRVLLDAAAYLPTNPLDLSVVKPDFVIMSWYKVFGFPTGVGCLVMKRSAARLLKRPWFSGGTIQAVSVGIRWHKMAPDEAEFEDGTVNFLSIPDILTGLDWIERIGMCQIQEHVREMTQYCLDQLAQLQHADNSEMCIVYGPQDTRGRGGTICFNILDSRGRIVDERIIGRKAAEDNISLRTGCFCNPGVGEDIFQLKVRRLYKLLWSKEPTIDEYIKLLGLPSAGAIRVSFGIATITGDIDRLISHLKELYVDQMFDSTGLPPRAGC